MSLFDVMGIASALADTAQTAATTTTSATPGQGSSFLHMLPMLIIFIVVFYFLLVRPQTKRAKEQKNLLDSLAIGDEVMSAGGIIGRITKFKDNYAVMEIAKGVEITVQKNSIATVLPKGTMSSME